MFFMAKVYPQRPTCSSYMTSRRETFTIWMKSLIFHGNGCTVFDSNGEIVYRIDNYGEKCSNQVCLMDLPGKILFLIHRKKFRLFGRWNGYKLRGCEVNEERPSFEVRKYCKLLSGVTTCHVSLGSDRASGYKILQLAGNSAFKIIDIECQLVAEVKQKQSSSGVVFGDDVLTLVVEPHIDHSLVMALVTVYALMNCKF